MHSKSFHSIIKQGIVSSIEIAKQIFKHTQPLKKALLIGSSKNILPLNEEDRSRMAELMCVPASQTSIAATFTKKLFNNEIGFDGTVFSVGDNVIIILNGQEIVVKLHGFLSAYLGGKHELLAKGVYYDAQLLETGQIETNFWSGFHKVKSVSNPNSVLFQVDCISRKVILYPTSNNSFTVVDYMRDARYLPSIVTVPVYPQRGDMLLIQGQLNHDIWYGHAQSVDFSRETVDVFFYVQSTCHSNPNVFVREVNGRRARNTVKFDSLLGIAEGNWSSPASKWIRTAQQ